MAPKVTMPSWEAATEPDIIGMVVRVVHADPAHDDGRRWVLDLLGRWMLAANGAWTWSQVLAETGRVVAVAFACQLCHGKPSYNPNDVINGYCAHCHGYTGTPAGQSLVRAMLHPDELAPPNRADAVVPEVLSLPDGAEVERVTVERPAADE